MAEEAHCIHQKGLSLRHCSQAAMIADLQLRVWTLPKLLGNLSSPLHLLQEGAPLPSLILLKGDSQKVSQVRHIVNVRPLHKECFMRSSTCLSCN